MTARLRGLPAGRAGRMWLRRRLVVAVHGGDLLDRKIRILLAEEQSFGLRVEQTRAEWVAAVRDLDRWMLRASLLSGDRGLRLAHDGADADVDVEWRLTMGVRYPAQATCRVPERSPATPAPDNSALVHATRAAERAVRAGVDQAVASTALDAVRSEIAATRRQLRAVTDRWIPRLQDARGALDASLDEQEHDEGVRLRWAATRAPVRRGPR